MDTLYKYFFSVIARSQQTTRQSYLNVNVRLLRAYLAMTGVVFFLAGVSFVFAAPAPQLMLTWRAGSYVSPSYVGKVLPGLNAPVAVVMQLIDDGKIIDVSKKEIRWFANRKLVGAGAGQASYAFQTDDIGLSGGAAEVKAVVVGYKGADVQRIVTIPIVAAEAVIRSPRAIVASGKNTLQALFYFWGVTNPNTLRLSWSANGAKVDNGYGERAIELQIPAVSQPTLINVTLSAKNPANEYEFANSVVTLTVQ